MESPGHNLFCSKQSMQYLWPTCRGEIFFVNVDFDVLGHPREKKGIPSTSGGTNTAINFFTSLCYLSCLHLTLFIFNSCLTRHEVK